MAWTVFPSNDAASGDVPMLSPTKPSNLVEKYGVALVETMLETVSNDTDCVPALKPIPRHCFVY